MGVRQGELLSPFLFAMFLNDIEEHLILNGFNGIDMYMTKLFLLLYADDTVIFADSAEELQKGLDVLHVYCQRWKLKINAQKTKVVLSVMHKIIWHRKHKRLYLNLTNICTTLYTDLRRKYIPRYYWCNPNMYKLQKLFCSKNRNLILRLSTYFYKAYY